MKYLFYLGHPAHFHLFKNIINSLKTNNQDTLVVIKSKDVLEDLVKNKGFAYKNVLSKERKNSKFSIAYSLYKRDVKLFKICQKEKPDLLLGSAAEISHVGKILNIPSIIFSEDDVSVIPQFAKLSYPFVSHILSPKVCNNEKWNFKTVNYDGYHELAYLHPNKFSPLKSIVNSYIPTDKRYFIIRFSKLNAYHDKGINGINDEIAYKLINILEKRGNVFLTSERKLPGNFEKYRISINPLDMHHVLAFSQIFIGDSQTMAAEAGVLGTPFIRYNNFVGKIGYLNDLENNYKLGFGVNSGDSEKLFDKVEELLKMNNSREIFLGRRDLMLREKIDVLEYFLRFINNYPYRQKNRPRC